MEVKKQNQTQLLMSLLLLLVTLTFSNCSKQVDMAAPEIPVMEADIRDASVLEISSASTGIYSINAGAAVSDGGYAYKVYGLPGTGDSESNKSLSMLRIFENGKELGPGHSSHSEIRSIGRGRFSHWLSNLYFSSSDNTDPKTNGRTYTYTLEGERPAAAIPNQQLSVPVGFASVNGQTTGGAGGQTITVNSYYSLKNAVESALPLIIRVSGTIRGTGFLNVKSNKTIQGTKGSSLEGVALLMYGSSNIIVQNMTIKNVIAYSNIIIKEGAHHIWIDHCDLSSDRAHAWDYYDGLLDVGRRADYITLSWNRLHDNNIAVLIGFGDNNTDDKGHLRVTLHHNYFYNISERQPSTRFGYIHCFNNYMRNGTGYAIGVTMGATVRTDNNYFENQGVPIYTDYNLKPGYVSGASTNIYSNSKANRISTSASSWLPPYEYKSVLIAAESVPSTIAAKSGAILGI